MSCPAGIGAGYGKARAGGAAARSPPLPEEHGGKAPGRRPTRTSPVRPGEVGRPGTHASAFGRASFIRSAPLRQTAVPYSRPRSVYCRLPITSKRMRMPRAQGSSTRVRIADDEQPPGSSGQVDVRGLRPRPGAARQSIRETGRDESPRLLGPGTISAPEYTRHHCAPPRRGKSSPSAGRGRSRPFLRSCARAQRDVGAATRTPSSPRPSTTGAVTSPTATSPISAKVTGTIRHCRPSSTWPPHSMSPQPSLWEDGVSGKTTNGRAPPSPPSCAICSRWSIRPAGSPTPRRRSPSRSARTAGSAPYPPATYANSSLPLRSFRPTLG